MFPEYTTEYQFRRGCIEAITGSMFSGKTEELIRRMKRAQLANQKVEIFKPKLDTRYSPTEVVSHNSNSIQSTPVDTSSNILLLVTDASVVGIDEAQFFDNGIVEVCQSMANRGIRVIVAGLDMDFRGKPFGPMPQILAIAEFVTKLQAICMHCGNLAYISNRNTDNEKLIMLGEKNEYEPLCRNCFNNLK